MSVYCYVYAALHQKVSIYSFYLTMAVSTFTTSILPAAENVFFVNITRIFHHCHYFRTLCFLVLETTLPTSCRTKQNATFSERNRCRNCIEILIKIRSTQQSMRFLVLFSLLSAKCRQLVCMLCQLWT